MFAYCNNSPINFVDFGGDILQSFIDDGNDINDFFDDVLGGAGPGGSGSYHYKVDFSIAARSTITNGGLHNCGVQTYGYTTSPMDTVSSSPSSTPSGVGNPVKTEGRGSTGRTTPNSLNEQMAMHQVKSNPLENAYELSSIEMSDPRWLASEGWVKMQSMVYYHGGKTEIHFNYNKETGAFDDFKFKWSN